MDHLWQTLACALGPNWLGTIAQIASVTFVGFGLIRSAQARELDVFQKLCDRGEEVSDYWRREFVKLPLEDQKPWAMMLLSHVEQIAVVSNTGWLKHWRLLAHFADTFDTAEWWLEKEMFADWRDNPAFLPEFKELRRRQKQGRRRRRS